MTRAEQIDRLRPYVRDLASRMRLKDWRIEVLEEVTDQKHWNASVSTIRGKKAARIMLCQDFFAKPAEERREALVHELVHLHLDATDCFVRDLLSDRQEHSYNTIREVAVDEIAVALAPHLPLPPAEESP